MNSFHSFDPASRVWVYQCNRILTPAEVTAIYQKATAFTDQWTAHQQLLKAAFDIRYNLFLIFCVDQRTATASGCSIDKSLHLVQQLEKDFNIRLLDRMMTSYMHNEEAIPFNVKELNTLYAGGVITDDTLVFNNLVSTLHELNTGWHIPLKQSWMMQALTPAVSK
jgi:hypothetical protein